MWVVNQSRAEGRRLPQEAISCVGPAANKTLGLQATHSPARPGIHGTRSTSVWCVSVCVCVCVWKPTGKVRSESNSLTRRLWSHRSENLSVLFIAKVYSYTNIST